MGPAPPAWLTGRGRSRRGLPQKQPPWLPPPAGRCSPTGPGESLPVSGSHSIVTLPRRHHQSSFLASLLSLYAPPWPLIPGHLWPISGTALRLPGLHCPALSCTVLSCPALHWHALHRPALSSVLPRTAPPPPLRCRTLYKLTSTAAALRAGVPSYLKPSSGRRSAARCRLEKRRCLKS